MENASTSQVCRQPCEDLAGVLTEIEGLRFVTGNLLEDLDRVVRQIRTRPVCLLIVALMSVHGCMQMILSLKLVKHGISAVQIQIRILKMF